MEKDTIREAIKQLIREELEIEIEDTSAQCGGSRYNYLTVSLKIKGDKEAFSVVEHLISID